MQSNQRKERALPAEKIGNENSNREGSTRLRHLEKQKSVIYAFQLQTLK